MISSVLLLLFNYIILLYHHQFEYIFVKILHRYLLLLIQGTNTEDFFYIRQDYLVYVGKSQLVVRDLEVLFLKPSTTGLKDHH